MTMPPAPSPTRLPARFWQPARIILLVAACALGLVFIVQNKGGLRVNDFLEYWSSARLLWIGQNPYDHDLMLALQVEHGLPTAHSTPLYYPPYILALILPFGLLDYAHSQILWLLFNVALVIFCSQRIWHFYGGGSRRKWLAWLIGFTFMPTYASLALTGQITPWMLVGATLFLVWIDQPGRGWLAGAATAFLAIKPQAFYLFFIALLLWSLSRRRWAVLAGLAGALAAGLLTATLIRPSILIEYPEIYFSRPLIGWATPTIGYLIRMLFAPTVFALQGIGPALGITWLLFYWVRHGKTWNWPYHLPLVLCISAITSFYTFTYDHIVLLIPAMALLLMGSHLRHKAAALALVAAYILTNLAYFLLHLRLDDSWFLWFPVAVLLLYLAAQRLPRQPFPAPAPQSSPSML